eukprot:4305333-Heterocapsa_arctica.AAC.1
MGTRPASATRSATTTRSSGPGHLGPPSAASGRHDAPGDTDASRSTTPTPRSTQFGTKEYHFVIKGYTRCHGGRP